MYRYGLGCLYLLFRFYDLRYYEGKLLGKSQPKYRDLTVQKLVFLETSRLLNIV